MKLTVMDYNNDTLDWVLESDLIVVHEVKKGDREYLKFKAFVHVFDNNNKHIGTLFIDYGSKWEIS